MGIKPLYYAWRDGGFYFASEQKALFAAGVPVLFDHDTWEELLCFRYVAGERTPYKGVKRLLPGHYLILKDSHLRTIRWWSLAERIRTCRGVLPLDAVTFYRETFDSAVDLRRISDVPVGTLLSGGLDSSSVAASLAAQAGSDGASFTVRFEEPGYDEGPLAAQVARRWGLRQHELVVQPEELFRLLHHASWLNDEPLVHGNDPHLFAISRYAKPRVTVLLSGEGADETLGGYVRYWPLRWPRLLDAIRPWYPLITRVLGLSGRMRKLGEFLAVGSTEQFVFFNSCDVLPPHLMALGMQPACQFPYRRAVLAEAQRLYQEPLRQAMFYDQLTFLCSILDRNDRMTMGASVECRVPFLDYQLVEMVGAMPTEVHFNWRKGKQLLRKAMHDRLPEEVLTHRKWGFGVPWERYLRQVPELRALVTNLATQEPIVSGPFVPASIRRLTRRFLDGDNTVTSLIRQLVMITVWYQACVAKPQRSVVAPSVGIWERDNHE